MQAIIRFSCNRKTFVQPGEAVAEHSRSAAPITTTLVAFGFGHDEVMTADISGLPEVQELLEMWA